MSPPPLLPLHNVSVGDSLLVYWDGDRKWYPGEVLDVRGDHECEFLYEDGEREWMSLNEIKFMARRNWKRSIRQRKNKDDDPFETIKKILFDIEDRLPTEGVFEKNVAWWKEWHDGILMDVELNNIRGLMNATLKVSLQLKPNITSTWWDTHSDEWKKRLQSASTVLDASLIVKELLTKAISWSNARDLFSNDKEQYAIVSEHEDVKGLNVKDGGQDLAELHKLSGGCFDSTLPNASSQKFFDLSGSSGVRNMVVESPIEIDTVVLPTISENYGSQDGYTNDELPFRPGNSNPNIGKDVVFLFDAGSASIASQEHKRDTFFVEAVDSRKEDMVMLALRKSKRLQVKPASDTGSASITSHEHRRDPFYVDAVDSWKENVVLHAVRRSNRLKAKPASDARGASISSHEHKRDTFCVDAINPRKGNMVMHALRRSNRLKVKPASELSTSAAGFFEREGLSGAPYSTVLSPTLSIESESIKDTTSDSSSVSDVSQQFEDSDTECSADSSVHNFCKTRKARFRSPDSMNHKVNKISPTRKDCLAEQVKMMRRAKRSKRSSVPKAVKYLERITNPEIVHDADLSDESYDEDASENGLCRSLDELFCYICQTGVAGSFLLLCDGIDCLRAFHTFCLYPPLQMVPEGDWLCPYCEEGKLFSGKLLPKKIKKIIGRRRITVEQEENSLQDQFLIKWESLSHHHDSWVPMEWVNHIDCVRLHSFQKNFPVLMGDVAVIDLRKPEWFKIDRVIACRRKFDTGYFCEIRNLSHTSHGSGELEFLVKWMGLDYSDATWESSCTVELLAEVDKLVCRHQRAFERSDNHCHSSHISWLDVQPSYLKGGVLYDYQMSGLNWMLKSFTSRRNVILADEMGLGKTVQVVSFVYCMKQENLSNLPVLIICPKSILFHWEKEFCHWAEELNVVVYQGERESRQCIRAHELYSAENRVLFDALIINYELVLLDNSVLRKFKWSAIIIDEAHKIKNLDSKLSICLSQYITDFRLLLTGTPLQNTLLELFALLHFLDPEEFSDPKAEADSFSTIGKESLDSDMKVSQIHELLRPRMLRRMKSDVLPGVVPAKKWVEVPCALTDSQRELYVNLLKKNYKELNRGIHSGRKITLNSLLMELRKCCNHPYLFPGREPNHSSREQALVSLVTSSGKLQLLEKLLPKLKERGNRVLLFSQFTTMLDILEDFLLLLGLAYFRIDGKTSTSARLQQLQEFNKPGSTVFIFLISTRAGGVGIDLPSADRVIIYDPDFNPFMDLQAQSRVHRIGQSQPVVVYQLITKCSVEEKILQKSRKKLAVENLVMNPCTKLKVDELHSVLLHGARKILSKMRNIEATSIHYDDNAIETLLKLDPAPDEKCVPDENGYLGGIQSFIPGSENEPPSSPKAKEWPEILGPVKDAVKSEDFGRGKRQKKAVNYECEDDSDNDEIYSPQSIETSSSDDSESADDSGCL